MPTSASASSPTNSPATSSSAGGEILTRLSSHDSQVKLHALRELKNRIIGNPTKKLAYVKLGLVPTVSSILSTADRGFSDLLIQSATVLGSFACGFDHGVAAVLDSGVFSSLVALLSHGDWKVVDAAARSLKIIYQSKRAPKYDFLQQEKMDFLVSLLNSEHENVTGLGASIIIHSCKVVPEQIALCEAGVLKKLIALLGELNQKDAILESIAAVIRNNVLAVSEFACFESGGALRSVVSLTKERHLRTRLLAATCLVAIRNASPIHLQDIGMKTKLVSLLLDLLEASGQVGDEAPFVFSSLISGKEDIQKLAYEDDAISKLYSQLQKDGINPRRAEGLFLAMADLCSKLEISRSTFLTLKAIDLVVEALTHESSSVRAAACICLRNVSRSIKSMCAGEFMNETILVPLVHLLHDNCTSVQVAALAALCNIVVDFNNRRSILEQCGGVKQLVQLSTSMDSALRLNALWALRNLVFHADKTFKEHVFGELTPSSLASLVCDSEPPVQEQALALLRNLVDGPAECIDIIFSENGIILDAVRKQMQTASKTEIVIHGMYVLCNVSSGGEIQKDAVTHQLIPQADGGTQSFVIRFLQSNDSQLRTATVWTIINLTLPHIAGASERVVKLRTAGIVAQLKNMNSDPCIETKLRVRLALKQILAFGDDLL